MAACACTRCAACALSPRPRSHPPTGTAAQQDASALNTSLHSTSRWVLRRLRARGLVPSSPGAPVLEIGAINTQLLLTPDLRVRAIDLHSSHPSRALRLLLAPHGGPADVATGTHAVLGGVLDGVNYVPANQRFEMLVGCASLPRRPRLHHLPRSCLAHSWTLDRADSTNVWGRPAFAVGGRARRLREGARRGPDRTRGQGHGAAVWGVGDASSHLGAQIAFECEPRCPTPSRRSFTRASGAAQARALRGAGRSAAAIFDVDLSGHLGFGHGCSRVWPRALVRDAAGTARRAFVVGGRLAEGIVNEAARMRRGMCSQESTGRHSRSPLRSSTGFKSVC